MRIDFYTLALVLIAAWFFLIYRPNQKREQYEKTAVEISRAFGNSPVTCVKFNSTRGGKAGQIYAVFPISEYTAYKQDYASWGREYVIASWESGSAAAKKEADRTLKEVLARLHRDVRVVELNTEYSDYYRIRTES